MLQIPEHKSWDTLGAGTSFARYFGTPEKVCQDEVHVDSSKQGQATLKIIMRAKTQWAGLPIPKKVMTMPQPKIYPLHHTQTSGETVS